MHQQQDAHDQQYGRTTTISTSRKSKTRCTVYYLNTTAIEQAAALSFDRTIAHTMDSSRYFNNDENISCSYCMTSSNFSSSANTSSANVASSIIWFLVSCGFPWMLKVFIIIHGTIWFSGIIRIWFRCRTRGCILHNHIIIQNTSRQQRQHV